MGGVYGDAILVPYHDSLVLFGGLENGTAMWSWNGSWTLIGNGPTMENAAMAWVP